MYISVFTNFCKIRITDWFFLKKNATLSYIGIEDAIVKINRKTKTCSSFNRRYQ